MLAEINQLAHSLQKIAERLFPRWIIYQGIPGVEIRALCGIDFLPPMFVNIVVASTYAADDFNRGLSPIVP